jgi:cell division protein FtsQ
VIGSGRSQAASGRRVSGAMPGRRETASRGRARTRQRLRRPRWLGPRFIAAVVAVVLLAGGGWLWLRNSSLVAVRQVTITGVSGPDSGQIRSALTGAARGMTTLNVKFAALQTAVKPYPVVKHLTVSTSFPHTMRITVAEQVPVAEISAAGRTIAVSADGTLLHDAVANGPLPTISVSVYPGGTHVDRSVAPEVQLLAAAPYALLAKVAQVSTDPNYGLIAALRNGPKVYFGDATNLSAKWSAAAAVLASSSSAGASYIDVTNASRPAAGSGTDTGSSAGSSSDSGAAGGTSTATNPDGTGTTSGG